MPKIGTTGHSPGKSANGTPSCKQLVFQANCVDYMLKMKERPQLILCDPPYNLGMAYEAYEDNKSYGEYMAWSQQWLNAASKVLHPHGSLFLFCPEEWVSELDLYCRKGLGLHKRRQIIWAFTFGQRANRNFTKAHCHILYFTRDKKRFTFLEENVNVPSARQLVYKDKRAMKGGKPPDDVWMLLKEQLEPYMGQDSDVWLINRICGTYKERVKHTPNQIPLPLYERLIKACSNESDLVLDPFAGSCGSGVVCQQLGRNWIGLEISGTCVEEGKKRLEYRL